MSRKVPFGCIKVNLKASGLAFEIEKIGDIVENEGKIEYHGDRMGEGRWGRACRKSLAFRFEGFQRQAICISLFPVMAGIILNVANLFVITA